MANPDKERRCWGQSPLIDKNEMYKSSVKVRVEIASLHFVEEEEEDNGHEKGKTFKITFSLEKTDVT